MWIGNGKLVEDRKSKFSGQNPKYVVEYPNFGQKQNVSQNRNLVKNGNCRRISKFWSNIEILIKTNLVNNQKFCQTSKFR